MTICTTPRGKSKMKYDTCDYHAPRTRSSALIPETKRALIPVRCAKKQICRPARRKRRKPTASKDHVLGVWLRGTYGSGHIEQEAVCRTGIIRTRFSAADSRWGYSEHDLWGKGAAGFDACTLHMCKVSRTLPCGDMAQAIVYLPARFGCAKAPKRIAPRLVRIIPVWHREPNESLRRSSIFGTFFTFRFACTFATRRESSPCAL